MTHKIDAYHLTELCLRENRSREVLRKRIGFYLATKLQHIFNVFRISSINLIARLIYFLKSTLTISRLRRAEWLGHRKCLVPRHRIQDWADIILYFVHITFPSAEFLKVVNLTKVSRSWDKD